MNNPNPAGNNTSAANALLNDQARLASAVRAGLPVISSSSIPTSSVAPDHGKPRIDGLPRAADRVSAPARQGLLIQTSYTFADAESTQRVSFREPLRPSKPTGNSATLRHAFKVNWVYQLPIGRAPLLGNVGSGLDRLVGGWEIGRIWPRTERPAPQLRQRATGRFDDKDLQKMYKIRKDDANRVVYILPQDVIDNTIKAFSTSATSPTGYSSLGPPTGRYFAPGQRSRLHPGVCW